jgi:hypothetical protein
MEVRRALPNRFLDLTHQSVKARHPQFTAKNFSVHMDDEEFEAYRLKARDETFTQVISYGGLCVLSI